MHWQFNMLAPEVLSGLEQFIDLGLLGVLFGVLVGYCLFNAAQKVDFCPCTIVVKLDSSWD